jgi:Escherichia/Staphylococcus phage prohead protease
MNLTDSGEFSGYASIFGVEDEGGDTVLTGAFAGGLDYFRSSGLVLWDHDTARPVATATALEDGIGLLAFGRFLGTPDGQMARQVVTETKDAGQPFGLSFGYTVLPGGARPGIRGQGRFLHRLKLLEISLVSLPMNRLARVRAVKYTPAEAADLDVHIRAVRERARSLGIRT